MSYYLAIDLGTTGCRSILFDSALHQVCDAYEEYGLITPKEKWTEQDAELWWTLTLRTAKEVIRKSGIPGHQISGISISSQGITIVPVDKNLNPLCNAISWLDVRPEKQCEQIEQDFGFREMFTHTGKQINPCYSLPKILWLRDELPEVYAQTWKFLMPMDFLIGKLTGRCVTDHSMASGTLMYDIKNCCWSKKVLDKYGIKESQLPELAWSGDVAGHILPDVAEELGMSTDCIVAVGAQDQKCAAVGAGLKDGVMTMSLGTCAAICKLWNEAKTEGDTRIGWCGYVREGTWVTEGVINTAGSCLRWLRDTMFPGESYDTINEEAADAIRRESSLMFYPYMNGPSSPDNYPDSDGCFYGVNLATKRGDFAMAVMEGVAFQIRIMLEAMEAYGNVHTLVLFGGGANSSLWCQIIADVTGMKITVPDTAEAASAGAAVLAGMATGEFSRNDSPTIRYEKQYIPTELTGKYEGKYRKYREIERKLWT